MLQILEGMMLPDANDFMMALVFGEKAQSFRREMRVDFSAIRTKGQNDRAVVCEAAAQPILGPSWETYKPADDSNWWAIRFELQQASAIRYSAQLTDANDEIVVEVLAKSNR